MKRKSIAVLFSTLLLVTLTACGAKQEQISTASGQNSCVTGANVPLPVQPNDAESTSLQATVSGETAEKHDVSETVTSSDTQEMQNSAQREENTKEAGETDIEEEIGKMMRMKINDTLVNVEWENNESVEALKALCENAPLVIQMSMYGGFEQVGSLGTRLPSSDIRTTATAGDIVLYSSSQLVIFYGSNAWAYTKLGHITDQDAAGMADLLSSGNVTITISMEEVK